MARRFVIKREEAPPADLTIDYDGELNEEQVRAVTSNGGPTLVVAGAGTGKTRTLIYRVAWLVETGVKPEQIVLLTFTRRSSREMLTRASVLLDGRCNLVRGGTFHAFCLSILKRHAARIGFPNNFTILDSADAADVVDVLRTRADIRKGEKRFPKKRTLLSMFSAVRNRGESIDDLLESTYPQFVEYRDQLLMLLKEYDRYKREHGLMDYDDLLFNTLRLFDEHPDIRKRVSAACRHVLVDEYQDTNRAQAELVRAFASVHGNVMVVGDDAQSIYRFRGADFRNILAFPGEFPGTEILKLEHNYRSTQSILDLANHILDSARRKYEKELFTERTDGDLPALVPAPDDRFESRFVAQMVLQLREEGIALADMAVLFRSGFNSYDLEVELNRRNIPFVKYGGLKLSEAAHIKDVLAHLKVIENPKDAIAWNRVLQLLEGIGPKTAGRIIEWIESEGDDPFRLRDRPYSARYIESLTSLFEMLRGVRGSGAPPARELETVLAYYEPVLKRVYYEDYPKREQDLDHFVALAESFSSRSEFLSSLALDPVELTALDAEPEHDDESPLVLSTIHSAKGLEFKVVFLIHALEGVLPSSYAVGDTDAMDEELRLLYVAVTRAADQLFISYPTIQYRRYDGQYFANPSRFIADVPEHLLEPWTLVEESRPALDASPERRSLPETTGDGAGNGMPEEPPEDR